MKKIYVLFLSCILFGLFPALLNAQLPFITIWESDNPGPSNDNQVTIPVNALMGDSFDVYWEEDGNPGNNGTLTDLDSEFTITFPSPGTYRVEITGDVYRIEFNNEGDKDKLIEIFAWGNIEWGTFIYSFRGCSNLVSITQATSPDLSNVTHMTGMFQDCSSFVGNEFMGDWNMGNVNNLQDMFRGATSFDEDLSGWDVSNVTNFSGMFFGVELSPCNYDALLESWSQQQLVDDANFHGGNSQYTSVGQVAKQSIIDNYDWWINDGGFFDENIEVIVAQEISCNGANDAILEAPPVPGDPTYRWYNDNEQTVGFQSFMTNVSPGTYTLEVRYGPFNSDCIFNATVDVTEPDEIDLSLSEKEDVHCFGESNGSISILADGGEGALNFSWSGPNGFNSEDQNIDNLSAGNYTVTVTDENDCEASESYTISEPDEIEITGFDIDHILCYGADNGAIDVVVDGGTGDLDFSWSGPESFTSENQNVSDLAPGTYTLVVTDENTCEISEDYEVTEPDELLITQADKEDVLCFDGDNGSIEINVNGGSGDYEFDWSGPNGFTSENQNVENVPVGTYSVTVTDDNDCEVSESFDIDEPNELSITSGVADSDGNLCYNESNGAIDITIEGGTGDYEFDWSGPNGFSSEDQNLTDLSAGTYSVIVSDENDCEVSESYEIITPDELTINTEVIENITCNGGMDGTIEVSLEGGTGDFTISWSHDENENSLELSNLQAGDYTLTVSDENECEAVESFTLTEPDIFELTMTGTNASTCGEDDAQINVIISNPTTTNYTIEWVGASSGNEIIEDPDYEFDITDLLAGNYTVTVTDGNGCFVEQDLSVSEDGGAEIEVELVSGTELACHGDEDAELIITSSDDISDYTFTWNNNETGSSIVVGAGEYSVSGDDGNCVTNTVNITVDEPDEVEIAFEDIHDVDCYGNDNGSVEISVSGGTGNLSISWDHDATEDGEIIDNLGAGNYTVTVTDENECAETESFTITEPEELLITDFIETDLLCYGDESGSITIDVDGGADPYNFEWTNDNGFTSDDQNIDNLEGGTYIAVVTDDNNCQITQDFNVDEPSPIIISGGIEESETLIVTGGTGDYSYDWEGPDGFTANTPTITPEENGEYTLTVTDENGCEEDKTFNVTTISVNEHQTIVISAYPNPASDQFFLETNSHEVSQLQMIDITGKLVKSVHVNSSLVEIDVANLKNGLYIYRVLDRNGAVVKTDKVSVAR